LSEDQKSSLRTEILKAQARFTDLQWQIEEATERLAGLLKQDHVDEQQALAQLDKVLSIEREIKRAQFALLIQIKNRLTPEQRTMLMQIRKGQR
jgi:Spy/CpxP family protein refolding chaperone